GKHIASLATGQLLLEKPDLERFRRQAKTFGFDEQKYLEALEEIPVVSEDQLRKVTTFLGSLAILITQLGYARLKSKEEALHLAEEVAERKRAEQAAQSSELKHRILHENMRDAFVSVAMSGEILEFNGAYQDMLGYTREELFTKTYTDLTPEKWHAFEQRIVTEQILPNGYSDVYEKEYRRKDGTVFPVELRAILMLNAAGEPQAMWGIIRDITQRKRAEEERIKMETKMLQVQKLEGLGILAGGIAHDFNNLLMGILGNIELSIEDLPPMSPIRDNLTSAMQAGKSAADLCRVLLASDGLEATEMFREAQHRDGERIDCIILDLTMPRMNGEQAFREIRQLSSDVPVLLSSGYNEEEILRPFAADAQLGFIHKPYQMATLMGKLRSLLGE
ncbi:MAG: PAS domain S-box protein, partial [Verrucomicrobia bacterium]|nr:PAS domain S-box protein [Verrucomicrobiota bacterium]